MDPLLGNFFLAEAARTGTVVAPIGIAHFVIRFDDVGAEGPVAIIDIAEMAGSVGADGDPPGWLFFDSVEQRAKYLAWLAESRSGSRKTRRRGADYFFSLLRRLRMASLAAPSMWGSGGFPPRPRVLRALRRA
jgi:hypothetical protein